MSKDREKSGKASGSAKKMFQKGVFFLNSFYISLKNCTFA
jgi:hypothetical protein